MGVEALDVLQFHWWDYSNKEYLRAMQHLQDLKVKGKIRELALTNFDTRTLRLLLDRGFDVRANQVQYSLIDQRPAAKMAHLATEQNVKLLAYGTLCGGLMTDRWLGVAEPSRASGLLRTPSMQKYYNMIRSWGSWELFQELLAALRTIGDRHGGASVASVAIRAILDRPAVGGVIVGVRLGLSEHIADTQSVYSLQLTDEDRDEIDAVTSRGNDLMTVIGDCGDEYR